MPLYDYRCRACSKVTEVRHGFREVYDAACPQCGGELARVFNPAGIVFKGSGFYVNDSRKASGSGDAATPSTSAPASKEAPSSSGAATPAPAAPPTTDSGPKKSESSAA